MDTWLSSNGYLHLHEQLTLQGYLTLNDLLEHPPSEQSLKDDFGLTQCFSRTKLLDLIREAKMGKSTGPQPQQPTSLTSDEPPVVHYNTHFEHIQTQNLHFNKGNNFSCNLLDSVQHGPHSSSIQNTSSSSFDVRLPTSLPDPPVSSHVPSTVSSSEIIPRAVESSSDQRSRLSSVNSSPCSSPRLRDQFSRTVMVSPAIQSFDTHLVRTRMSQTRFSRLMSAPIHTEIPTELGAYRVKCSKSDIYSSINRLRPCFSGKGQTTSFTYQGCLFPGYQKLVQNYFGKCESESCRASILSSLLGGIQDQTGLPPSFDVVSSSLSASNISCPVCSSPLLPTTGCHAEVRVYPIPTENNEDETFLFEHIGTHFCYSHPKVESSVQETVSKVIRSRNLLSSTNRNHFGTSTVKNLTAVELLHEALSDPQVEDPISLVANKILPIDDAIVKDLSRCLSERTQKDYDFLNTMTAGMSHIVRFYKTPEMCRNLSFGESHSGACLLLMAPESSILWALISVSSPYPQWHSWLHVDANYSNCSLESNNASVMSLSFLILNPLDGHILELARWISDQEAREDGDQYLYAYRLIQKFVYIDLKRFGLSRLLPPEPNNPDAIVLQPAGLIGDSHGGIHRFMTTVIPESENQQINEVGSRIRDCGQHFRHGLNLIKAQIHSCKLENEVEIQEALTNWAEAPDVTQHPIYYQKLHDICSQYCPTVLGSIEWYEVIFAKWHPSLRPGNAPLTSLCEARYGFLNRTFGGKGSIYKNVLAYAAQFVHFRTFMIKLHSNLLSTKDHNSISTNQHRESVRLSLRSHTREVLDTHSSQEIVKVGTLNLPKNLAEDIILSDSLMRLYRSKGPLNRTHRPDQTRAEVFKEHDPNNIFCRCGKCTLLLLPINGTTLSRRKRKIGKLGHRLTLDATESALNHDFRFSSIKVEQEPIRFSFEIFDEKVPARKFRISIGPDVEGEGPRSLKERGVVCDCQYWQRYCLAGSCQKGSFPIDIHVSFVFRVFFLMDPDSACYRSGSFTLFDMRMALRKRPLESPIYRDMALLTWNSLTEFHSVYDVKTNMTWNAHSSLLSGVFISVEKLSLIAQKTLCHGCRQKISPGDLTFKLPGLSHFTQIGRSTSTTTRVNIFTHPTLSCLQRSLSNKNSFKSPEQNLSNFKAEIDYIFILDSIWTSLSVRQKEFLIDSPFKIAARSLQTSFVVPKVRTRKRGLPAARSRSEHAKTPDDRVVPKLVPSRVNGRAKLPRNNSNTCSSSSADTNLDSTNDNNNNCYHETEEEEQVDSDYDSDDNVDVTDDEEDSDEEEIYEEAAHSENSSSSLIIEFGNTSQLSETIDLDEIDVSGASSHSPLFDSYWPS